MRLSIPKKSYSINYQSNIYKITFNLIIVGGKGNAGESGFYGGSNFMYYGIPEFTAFRGTAFRGTAFRGTAFRGTAFRGTAFRDTAFRGTAFRGTAFRGTIPCILTRNTRTARLLLLHESTVISFYTCITQCTITRLVPRPTTKTARR